MTGKRVAIIGAGISGLAHAEVLGRCGFVVTLFERAARVGGVWACAYPGVRLQNSAREYHLSSFPWPFTPDQHPTGEQILRYLDALIADRRFDVRLAHEVVSARRGAPGGWDLVVRAHRPAAAASQDCAAHFDHLVIAIGQYTARKHRPALPGEAAFRGELLTERELDAPARFDGKRVVVVGFGKSALDMASFAVGRAKSVQHLFRTPRWTLPRTVLGIHFTKLLFNRFASSLMPCWTHPTGFERFLNRRRALVGGNWAAVQQVFTWVVRRAARGSDEAGAARIARVLPSHSLIGDLRSATALAPPTYFSAVASGAIEPQQGELAGLYDDGVELGDGRRLPADVVMLALGSLAPRFPFLDDPLRALLEADDDGVQLYRHILHPQIPDLAFAGFNHGFMHVPAAEIGALWLAALWQGRLMLPEVEEMMHAVRHVQDWKRAHIHFEPSRSCAVNTRFQQYLDILLKDLGLSPYRKLPNLFAEVFAAYGARDYAGVVDEYLLGQTGAAPRRPLVLPT